MCRKDFVVVPVFWKEYEEEDTCVCVWVCGLGLLEINPIDILFPQIRKPETKMYIGVGVLVYAYGCLCTFGVATKYVICIERKM